jgi:gliding motility-associated-like protein
MKILSLVIMILYAHFSMTQLSFTGDNEVCKGDQLILYAAGDSAYSWALYSKPDSIISTSYILSSFPRDSSSYLLYGTSDTILVSIDYGGYKCICKCFVPNVFTPNGDLFNNEFFPIVNCGENVATRMTICNGMGKVVFDDTSWDLPSWDGINSETGMPMSQGIYIWRVSFLKDSGELIHYEGHVLLSR